MTIVEIAKMAGVSRMTVSRVINGGYVSPETRERVEKVLNDNNYMINMQAQALRGRKTKMIGIIVPALDSNSVVSITSCLLDDLYAVGYQAIIMQHREEENRIKEVINQMKSRGVDGIVLFVIKEDKKIEEYAKKINLPVITIGPFTFESVSGVMHDDAQGFRNLTQKMISLGNHKFGYAFPSMELKMSWIRAQAIVEELEKAKLPIEFKWLRSYGKEGVKHEVIGREIAQEFLCMKELPEVVMCASDTIALALYDEFYKAGIKIPEQIKITGFGNMELGKYMPFKLPTVGYDFSVISNKVKELLLDKINKNQSETKKIKISPLLLN